jgi:hypothetical protein
MSIIAVVLCIVAIAVIAMAGRRRSPGERRGLGL